LSRLASSECSFTKTVMTSRAGLLSTVKLPPRPSEGSNSSICASLRGEQQYLPQSQNAAAAAAAAAATALVFSCPQCAIRMNWEYFGLSFLRNGPSNETSEPLAVNNPADISVIV